MVLFVDRPLLSESIVLFEIGESEMRRKDRKAKMKDILFKYMTRLTSLDEEEQQAIVNEIQIEEFKKGTILLRQGDVPTKCYFILKGCIRQYPVDEAGKEVTSNHK
jgi:CRP-like cAMP-binding protein